MNVPNESTQLTQVDSAVAEKAGRRRFLGAGATAAPVVLTMLSQPALGVTCFSPSRALSRNTSVSQAGNYGECTGAQSPGNYSQQTSGGSPAYSWPTAVPPSTPFHPTFAKFSDHFMKKGADGQSTGISMTMIEVLNLNGNEDPSKMAFHLIGAYLNCLGGNGAVIHPAAMTAPRVLDIWVEWARTGSIEVTAGVLWDAEAIIKYLKYNGIVG